MSYKEKYFKYKTKYLHHVGGASTTIPTSIPGTQSFLFMPIIYYALDKNNVTLIDEFERIVIEGINTVLSMGMDCPYTNLEEMMNFIKQQLSNHGINNVGDLRLDGNHHIPGDVQEIVTGYREHGHFGIVFNYILYNLIENHSGKSFVYNV